MMANVTMVNRDNNCNNTNASSESEEVIERLFPKCRPKTMSNGQVVRDNNTTTSSQGNSNSRMDGKQGTQQRRYKRHHHHHHHRQQLQQLPPALLVSDPLEDTDVSSSTCPPSPVKETEIVSRQIGSVPIAEYEGSPRRYGPKPPGYPRRIFTTVNPSATSASAPAPGSCISSARTTIVPTSTTDAIAPAQVSSSSLVDVTCDELVLKSILSIPLDAKEASSPSSTASSRSAQSHFTDRMLWSPISWSRKGSDNLVDITLTKETLAREQQQLPKPPRHQAAIASPISRETSITGAASCSVMQLQQLEGNQAMVSSELEAKLQEMETFGSSNASYIGKRLARSNERSSDETTPTSSSEEGLCIVGSHRTVLDSPANPHIIASSARELTTREPPQKPLRYQAAAVLPIEVQSGEANITGALRLLEKNSEHSSDATSPESTPSSEEGLCIVESRQPALDSPANQSDQGVASDSNKTDDILLLHDQADHHQENLLLQDLTTLAADSPPLLAQNKHQPRGLNEISAEIASHHFDGIRNFTLSPESTDCDSNEIESEFSLGGSSGSKVAQMPVLEDGLSSGCPSSDSEYEFDSGNDEGTLTLEIMKKQISEIQEEVRTKYGNNSDKVRGRLSRKSPNGHRTLKSSHAANSKPTVNGLSDDQDPAAMLNVEQAFEVAKQNKLDLNPTSVSDDERSVTGKAATGDKGECLLSGHHPEDDCDTDQETDRLLGAQRTEDKGSFLLDVDKVSGGAVGGNGGAKKKNASREVLIEGVLFRARYLGSTQLVCEGQPTKATRMMQAEEAVSRIKSLAPEGETQPSTEVDLFISTEKIMVLNTDLKEIMMDHSLRTISYIADIGDLLVLMARRRPMSGSEEEQHKIKRTPKMICHVFESEEAQFIAQSIGQAFQVAYMEFLKANGIEDSSFVKEMDYQEVLNSQEIFGDELDMFAKKDRQKEVIVPKQKNEILGMVIVESGWGSMLPTVVIANMAHGSPASRCGVLNIGDQIIAINGVSLVGLPLSTCQHYIKNTKMQTAIKLTVVPCPPVVEVKIKRPDTKYQLGFSVQNGVICSLLRGGIAERGGVRVGHRIIEINGQSVVAVPHERIVSLLATSVGEICMKTMPTSMFRLLTGQETPVFI